MKIALVCHRFPPFTGGLERHVSELNEGLKSQGVETIVVTTCPDQDVVAKRGYLGLRAIQLPAGGYYYWPGFLMPSTLKALEDVDVIHSFGITFFAPVAALFWKRMGRHPAVLSALYHPVEFTPHVFVRTIYDKSVLGALVGGYDATIVHSNAERDALLPMVHAESSKRLCKVEIASKILNVPSTHIGLRERFGASGSVLVLCVGRIDFFKGFDEVVEAALILRGKGLDIRIIHVGPKEAWFREDSLLTSSGMDFATSLGRVSESVLASAYRECDITVVPSKFEAFGLVAIESLLLGTPVVSTRTGIMNEVIREGVNGAFYTSGEPRSLADALERLIHSRTCGLSSAREPLVSVEKFGKKEREVKDILRLYSELV